MLALRIYVLFRFSSQPSHHEPSTGAPMKAVGSGTEPTPKLPSPQSVPSQHNPKHVLVSANTTMT